MGMTSTRREARLQTEYVNDANLSPGCLFHVT